MPMPTRLLDALILAGEEFELRVVGVGRRLFVEPFRVLTGGASSVAGVP